jgi:hypothetical protein
MRSKFIAILLIGYVWLVCFAILYMLVSLNSYLSHQWWVVIPVFILGAIFSEITNIIWKYLKLKK